MQGYLKAALWGALGALTGILIPLVLALLLVAVGYSAEQVGVLSFFSIILVPLGVVVGISAALVWSAERTFWQNVGATLMKMFWPFPTDR